MLSRFFKIVCFGVMTSFVGLGPVYETIVSGGETRAFTGLALVLMTLRFMLTIQYGIVLYFVRGFHKTLIPLVLTMAIYAAAGIAFLITYLVDRSIPELNGIQGASHIVAWYIILGIEIAGVMVVSSVWRILSFRHTHLVERVGLLTLIVMGEGILGLTKSLAYDVMGRNVSIWQDAGLIVPAVILIVSVVILFKTTAADISSTSFTFSTSITSHTIMKKTTVGEASANKYGLFSTTASTSRFFSPWKVRQR